MKFNNFLGFYHPTMTYFIDDDKNFLNTMILDLSDQIDMRTFVDCTQFLKEVNSRNKNIEELLVHQIEEYTPSDKLVEVDLTNLHTQIYNRERFKRVSVVVVDYSMPEITGLELCKKISNKNVLKIMLTAEADQNTAIRAFNEGIIDKFILKHDENLNNKLVLSIQELQLQYFANLSRPVMSIFADDFQNLLDIHEYNNVFEQVKKSSKAIEFYLLDKFGSFLFLNDVGKTTWLIIRSYNELKNYALIARDFDENIYRSLDNGNKLLFQLTKEDLKTPVSAWYNYLYDAIKLSDTYCYAVINARTHNGINCSRIAPYNRDCKL
jgi:FixJ family two-component response regulator